MNKQLKELESARNKALYDLGVIDIQKTNLENQRNNILNFLQKLANDEQELRKSILETIPESPPKTRQESPPKTRQESPPKTRQESPPKTSQEKSFRTDKIKNLKSKEKADLKISGVQMKN